MREKLPFHDIRFDSIQMLRGLAAVLVVLEHIRFLNCGAFGVDIFFCISGFMLMFSTHKNTEHFFMKRLLRIAPFYYLVTLGTFAMLLVFPGLFESTQANPVYLLKSLLFIPFDIGGGILQPLVRIGWTVNCEMFFYLIFGLSLQISHRWRGLLASAIMGSLVLLGQLFAFQWAPAAFYSDPVMLEFILGILAYYAAMGIYRLYEADRLPRLLAPLCLLLALGLFAGLILTKPTINILELRRPLVWGIPALCIVLCFLVFGFFRKAPAWTVRLGDASFSLYLIHYYPVLFIDRKLCDFSTLRISSVTGAVLAVALCIALAFIAWYVIEKKLTGLLRRRLLPPQG